MSCVQAISATFDLLCKEINKEIVGYASNRRLSATMIPKEVLHQSLNQYLGFIKDL
jgi:hypothetical protein